MSLLGQSLYLLKFDRYQIVCQMLCHLQLPSLQAAFAGVFSPDISKNIDY